MPVHVFTKICASLRSRNTTCKVDTVMMTKHDARGRAPWLKRCAASILHAIIRRQTVQGSETRPTNELRRSTGERRGRRGCWGLLLTTVPTHCVILAPVCNGNTVTHIRVHSRHHSSAAALPPPSHSRTQYGQSRLTWSGIPQFQQFCWYSSSVSDLK